MGECPHNFKEIAKTSKRYHEMRWNLKITTLSLQLLQNCLMLINTLLVEHTIAQYQLLEQLSEEDRRALTPLFYEHVNPYGLFELDLDRPPLLEAA